MPPDTNSMRQFSQLKQNHNQNSIGMLTQNSNTSSRRQVLSHSPLKMKGKDWVYKVDDLIGKFDASFRQNEI